jgi:hypothetical protein
MTGSAGVEADPTSRVLRIPTLAVAVGLVLYQVFAVFRRYLVNDDFQTLYTAWLRFRGKVPGRDFFLASYYLLTDLLAPLFRFDRDPWLPLYATRLLFVGVMAIIALLLYRIATRLCSPAAGWLAPILALSSAAMVYRGLDLRPDLITTAAWLALFALLTSKRISMPAALLVGALVALSILNRFKAMVILPFPFLEYFARRNSRTFWRCSISSAAGMAIVFGGYVLWLAATHDLATFLDVNRRLFAESRQIQILGTGARGHTFAATLTLDAIFWAFTGVGVVLRAGRRAAFAPHENRLCVLILTLAVLTVVLNPVYYEYNLLTLQPLIAPFAAYGLARVIALRKTAFAAAAFTLLPVLAQWPSFARSLEPSNAHQKDLQTFLLRYTKPDSRVFAMEGVGLYRPSLYHWRMPWIYGARYREGEWRYEEEFRRDPPEIVVTSYRVPAWMVWSDRQFLASHYVTLTPQILVPGFSTSGEDGDFSAELLVDGEYEALRQGAGGCWIDGQPFSSGQHPSLRAGVHRIRAVTARCSLRRFYKAGARMLIANPRSLPYLVPVYLGPGENQSISPSHEKSSWRPLDVPVPGR